MTATQRIVAAVKAGAETVADIEVDLDFTLTRRQIAALAHNIKKRGILGVSRVVMVPGCRKHAACQRAYAYTVLRDPKPTGRPYPSREVPA